MLNANNNNNASFSEMWICFILLSNYRIANATQKKESDDESEENDPADNDWSQEKKIPKLLPLGSV